MCVWVRVVSRHACLSVCGVCVSGVCVCAHGEYAGGGYGVECGCVRRSVSIVHLHPRSHRGLES